MTIFEDARNGMLSRAWLDIWLLVNRDALTTFDPTTGWTLLATAVVAGYPQQVEMLLEHGAKADQRCRDGETALLLAAWKTQMERPLIIQKLLRKLGQGVGVDDTCELAGNKTPIMFVLEKQDVDSVRLLAQGGAKPTVKNNDGFTAVQVAQTTGNRSLVEVLNSNERANLARLSSIVVTMERHIVSWVDTEFNGFMGRFFGFRGKYDKNIEKAIKRGPQKPTAEEFLESIDTYIENTPVLNAFFEDRRFTQKMARKIVDLANQDVLPRTIEVAMHQQVIYCDDSSSMVNRKGKAEKRWDNQKDLVLRIARTTTRILPDTDGVTVCFINSNTMTSNLDFAGIEQALDSAKKDMDKAKGNTAIGTQLRTRILKPLVYQPLAAGTLQRPLLVSILTDGGPSKGEESIDMLARVIVECGEKLAEKQYPRDCVKFLICQIGSSNEAVGLLDSLREDPRIATVSHIYANRLDDKFKPYRNERMLDRWLVETLFQPLATGGNA